MPADEKILNVMIKSQNKDLKRIKERIQNYQEKNKIVFFVGAGLSALSGMPSWRELIIKIADEIGYKFQSNGDDVFISSNEFLKVPQIFYDSLPEDKADYFKFIKKNLNKKASTNVIHNYLMQINPYHIITTNYDNLLETAAIEHGRVYSLINSDAAVSKAETQKYILKVHGDFAANNFVLKEDDYLNYSEKFKLIEAVLKSILATNLVIFMGYGLNDYNIKLIQNWVKQVQVQSNSYIEPVFIYTGGKNCAPDVEKKYYYNQQIDFVDAGEITGKVVFEDQYKEIITYLFDGTFSQDYKKSVSKKLDVLEKQFKPIASVRYLRAEDISGLFYGSKLVGRNMLDISKSEELSDFVDIYNKKDKQSAKSVRRIDTFIKRLYESGIDGLRGKNIPRELNKLIFRGGIFSNHFFNTTYQDIDNGASGAGTSAEDFYHKAYDLCMLGHFKESMDCYDRAAALSNKEKNWTLYYLCTVNIRLLRHLMLVTNFKTSGFQGYINFGADCNAYTEEEIEALNLKVVFNEIPSEYSKYYFFDRLKGNYYKDDMALLFSENYKMEQEIASGRVTLVGRSTYENIMLRMLDAVSFIYENKIILSVFAEHKDFVKISLDKYLDGFAARLEIKNKIHLDELEGGKPETVEIDVQMLLLLAKNLNHKEIRKLCEKYKSVSVKISNDEREKIELFAAAFMSYIKDKDLRDIKEENIELYFMIHSEIGAMAVLIPLVCSSEQILNDFLIYALYFVNDKEMSYMDKVWPISVALEKLAKSTLGCEKALVILRDFVTKMKSYCVNPQAIEINKEIIAEYFVLINKYDKSSWKDEFLKSLSEDGNLDLLSIYLKDKLLAIKN